VFHDRPTPGANAASCTALTAILRRYILNSYQIVINRIVIWNNTELAKLHARAGQTVYCAVPVTPQRRVIK
jgi:hypothetical protein